MELTLLVPGIRSHAGGAAGDTPLFDRVRGRLGTDNGTAVADPLASAGALLELFGLAGDTEGPPPVAALGAFGDGLAAQEGTWLRADPVCLQPSGADLLLMPTAMLDVGEAEAEALIGTLQETLGDDAGDWYRGRDPARWYLRVPEPIDARFLPPPLRPRRGLEAELPTGADATYWIRLMNEIQMILHEHPVNEAREAEGQVPVNSVWFWGTGSLPAARTSRSTPWDRVWTDDPVALGASRLQGIGTEPLPADADTLIDGLPGAGHALVVLGIDRESGHVPHDEEGCALEREWLEPACEAVLAGRIRTVTITDRDRRSIRIGRADLRPWWRRWLP